MWRVLRPHGALHLELPRGSPELLKLKNNCTSREWAILKSKQTQKGTDDSGQEKYKAGAYEWTHYKYNPEGGNLK